MNPAPELSVLFRYLTRRWRILVTAAVLGGVAAGWIAGLLSTPQYAASARLFVHGQVTQGNQPSTWDLFEGLFESDHVVSGTVKRLRRDGVLGADEGLEDLAATLETGRSEVRRGAVVSLTARAASGEKAAAIANAWAQVAIEESREATARLVADTDRLVEDWLTPTRDELGRLNTSRTEILEEFAQREAEVWAAWEQASMREATKAAARFEAHRVETRKLMEAAVDRWLADHGGEAAAAGIVRGRLAALVGVRTVLASTEPVLDLETGPGPDLLAELLAEGSAVVTEPILDQEVNPTHDALVSRGLELESDSRLAAVPGIADLFEELDAIQVTRYWEFHQLAQRRRVDLQAASRDRSRQLESLQRQRQDRLLQVTQAIDQARDLEGRLTKNLNDTVLASLVEQIDVMSVAIPAYPSSSPVSRRIAIKVVFGIAMGLSLGLLLVLLQVDEAALRDAAHRADPADP